MKIEVKNKGPDKIRFHTERGNLRSILELFRNRYGDEIVYGRIENDENDRDNPPEIFPNSISEFLENYESGFGETLKEFKSWEIEVEKKYNGGVLPEIHLRDGFSGYFIGNGFGFCVIAKHGEPMIVNCGFSKSMASKDYDEAEGHRAFEELVSELEAL